MIENTHSGFMVECDGCGDGENFKGFEFMEIIAKIKADGWLIKKDGEDWEHYCPRCAAKDY